MAAAAKKNNKTKAPAKSGAPAGRRSVSGRTGAEAKTPAMPPEREENRLYRLLGGLACLLLALCTAVSYFQADALLLGLLRQALTGLFGYGYWLWAAAFLAMGLFLLLHREQKALGRVLCTALIPLLAGSLLHLALARNYQAYLETNPQSSLAKNGIRGCNLAQQWEKTPTRYVVKKATMFNSRRSDFAPMFLGEDFDQVYFSSSTEKALGKNKSGITGTKNCDLFFSKKNERGAWQKPEPIEAK